MNKSIYSLQGLDFAYPGKPALSVFQDFSWEMQEGENWAFIGPSGCGKSTLLHLLAGLLRPDRGSLRFFQESLQSADPRIGTVLQSYGLFPWKTVAQNVELPLKLAGLSKFERKEKVHERLESIGLSDYGDSFPRALSGGQRQRVAIARALILGPSVLLMDEPFSALDAFNREKLQDEVLSMAQKRGVHFVLVTHQIDEAIHMADKILLFKDLTSPPVVLANLAGPLSKRSDPAFIDMTISLRNFLRGGEEVRV